jgi:hypothetical protein
MIDLSIIIYVALASSMSNYIANLDDPSVKVHCSTFGLDAALAVLGFFYGRLGSVIS